MDGGDVNGLAQTAQSPGGLGDAETAMDGRTGGLLVLVLATGLALPFPLCVVSIT